MSDDTESKASNGPDKEGPGSSLRRAREARGMGIMDIAQELHLDAWMIEALEADDFEALGAPVFAKGHLRQYGALLGLATDDLMIGYYRVRGRHDTPAPPITSTMTRPEKSRRAVWAGVLLAVVVLGSLAALLWFYAQRDGIESPRAPDVPADPVLPEVREPAPGLAAPPPATDGPRDAAETEPAVGTAVTAGVADTPEISDTSGMDDAGASEQPVAASPAAPPPQPAPVADEVLLRLDFSGESWVEVYDRNGNRLVYGMYGPTGSRTVRGATPIEIYLGRSRDVSLTVDGRAYPVPPDTIRGNTARFVVRAGGR